MKLYDNRIDMISSLLSKGSSLAEIGIFKGVFSEKIQEIICPSSFLMIDLFTGRTGSGDQDGNNYEDTDMNNEYNRLTTWSKKFPNIKILKGDSSKVLETLEDNSLCAIYIDGDHGYEGCKKDLLVSYRKVKPGGFIMGHDYEMNMTKAKKNYVFGVKKAVDEFCLNFNQEICAKGNDGCVSYAIKLSK